MKSSYKLALLAALGLASVTAAQAQSFYNDGSGANAPGDLIVGIFVPGSANTQVADLGSFSSLFNGETWNASQLGLASAGLTTPLSSTTQFGVAGDLQVNLGGGDKLYVSGLGGSSHTPPSFGVSTWQNIDAALGQVQLGAAAVGSGGDWSTQANPQSVGSFGGAIAYNPNATGSALDNLYTVTDNNSAPKLDGTFSLNDTTGTLTFNAVAVPEPTTYGLVAGAGLLIVSLRNKFSRKQV